MTEPELDWDTVMEQRAEMERDAVPVMPARGKRFACERCGATCVHATPGRTSHAMGAARQPA